LITGRRIEDVILKSSGEAQRLMAEMKKDPASS